MLQFRRQAVRITNFLEDKYLGITTNGRAPAEATDHVYYATVSYIYTKRVLDKLQLSQDDNFIDVGCGKGRVVCLAARMPVGEVVGVEYSPTLAAIAQENSQRVRGRIAPVRIVCAAAENFDYSNASALYLFNPFEASLLDKVLAKVEADRARPLRMAFVMESPVQRDVFSKHSWLSCYERYTDEEGRPISYYRTN